MLSVDREQNTMGNNLEDTQKIQLLRMKDGSSAENS